MASWKQRSHIFRSVPRQSLVIFLLGVACLFAADGAANNLFDLDHYHLPRFLFVVASYGLFTALYVWFGSMRMIRALIILAFVHAATILLSSRFVPNERRALTAEQVRTVVVQQSALVVIFINVGWILLLAFMRSEGQRFFAAHTEIELASAIQRQLVPPLSVQTSRFEAYGTSLPSGAVGGDLFDIVTVGGSSLAYVADVAGHGVKAGVLMSMIKASVRTRFSAVPPDGVGLLEGLNEVLLPLTDAQSYATFAFVVAQSNGRLSFSLAGHLPIFRFDHQSKQVEQHEVSNLPVAMFANTQFQVADLPANPGDVIAIITDGLTEVFNRRGGELGYRYIEEALQTSDNEPLRAVADRIFQASEQFGAITDDRTLLLLRLPY